LEPTEQSNKPHKITPTIIEALQPSYMLLPSFSFLPNRDLRLGTVLTSAKGSKIPDPKRPLNKSTRVPIPASETTTQEYKPWSWDSSKSKFTKAGLHAGIALLTGLGGSISKEGAKGYDLAIDCDRVLTTTFRPDKKYLARTVQDTDIKRLGEKKFLAPPLYMIVGLMVANGANVTISHNRSFGFSGDLSVDGTSNGIPLSLGPEAEHSHSSSSKLRGVPTEPFILAYEVVRLRMKRHGKVEERDEKGWALFRSCVPVEIGRLEDPVVAEFEEEWEVEGVTLEDVLGDE
jgi:hypothetical protein